MKRLLFLIPILYLAACQKENAKGFLSSATLESDLWKISSAVAGTLVEVAVREGDSVTQGQVVVRMDSVPMFLKLDELRASRGELVANIKAKEAEIATLVATDEGIQREWMRATKLVNEGALTMQRKDDLETQAKVSQARIAALRSGVDAMKSKFAMLHAQENTLRNQIARCQVLAPESGRILTRYRNQGEIASAGLPLLELGRTDTLWADFFIAQTELARFQLGQPVRLRLDVGSAQDSNALWVPARISWIAHEAEFTPKGVQTREARNELVFRARALAANSGGRLKRGMPVEVWE